MEPFYTTTLVDLPGGEAQSPLQRLASDIEDWLEREVLEWIVASLPSSKLIPEVSEDGSLGLSLCMDFDFENSAGVTDIIRADFRLSDCLDRWLEDYDDVPSISAEQREDLMERRSAISAALGAAIAKLDARLA